MAGGRPTAITPEIIEKAIEYSTKFNEVKWEHEVVPSIAGLARYIGVCRDTIRVNSKGSDKFSGIVKGILTQQEIMLAGGGLTGKYTPAIAKLMLSKHGYSDKQEVDHTSSDKSMTPSRTLDVSKLSTDQLKALDAAISEEDNADANANSAE